MGSFSDRKEEWTYLADGGRHLPPVELRQDAGDLMPIAAFRDLKPHANRRSAPSQEMYSNLEPHVVLRFIPVAVLAALVICTLVLFFLALLFLFFV
jgi:hypothetical protein